MSLLEDTIAQFTAETVAQYTAGGLEPDGVGLSKGRSPDFDANLLGWGTDLACRDDITENADEVDANSPEAVAQDLWHRLITPHGKILSDPDLIIAVGEDPDYGYGLGLALSVGVTELQLQVHQDLGAAECKKDDRVSTCTLEITRIDGALDHFNVHLYGELKTGQAYNLVQILKSGPEQIESETAA